MIFKKKFISILIFFCTYFCFCVDSAYIFNQTKEFKLENGCEVFLLEDSSSAFVRIDFSVKAGFSSQTIENTGFFKLYSRLLENHSPLLKFTDVQCNSDSTRYILEIPYSDFYKTIDELSQLAYSPSFSDKEIKEQLDKLKAETIENEKNPAYFINSAIDSRVFSDTPWKHDSGIYPALLKKYDSDKARVVLSSISEKWYNPQNSALFISGNIKNEDAIKVIKQTFGSFYSSAVVPTSKPQIAMNKQKKFVLYHKDISPDLTQVVVQYTSLDNGQTVVAEEIYNNPSSKLKTDLLQIASLNIPGDEYINVAAASKKDSNRLIIQSLMQLSSDKKSKSSSIAQANAFVEALSNSISNISIEEFYSARQNLTSKMNTSKSSPASFMDLLSSFWAVEKYSKTNQENQTSLLRNFEAENNYILEVNPSSIIKNLQTEEPYIFVIVSSSDYEKNKNEYKKNGFVAVNSATAAWYNQEIFKDAKKQTEDDPTNEQTEISLSSTFFEDNINSIKTQTLKNGINIFTKENPFSYQSTILIKIDGGKINTAKQNGMEEVIVSLISGNIERELYKNYMNGLILTFPAVTYETSLSSSYVKINCDKDDFRTVVKTAASAIIYNKIIPSDADRAVSSRQYKKRLENGSSVNQVYFAAMKAVFPDSVFANIFNTNEDVLVDIKYDEIVSEYPFYLDANKYSLITSGFIQNDLIDIFEDSFGLLKKIDVEINTNDAKPQISSKSITTTINHTFLTDIPSEKAGAMPQILIPTTTFLDPVLFGISGENDSQIQRTLSEAIFCYIKNEVDESSKENKRLNGVETIYQKETANIPLSFLIFRNVPHTKEIDAIYKNSINKLKTELSSSTSTAATLQELKSIWIINQLDKTKSDEGNAELIFEGLDEENNPHLYLDKYKLIESATAKDFLDGLENIPSTPNIRVYSKDSTK